MVLMALCVLPAFSADDMGELAFPGAEGYGRYATGGRGGTVYVVTSLDDCAETNLREGTFRWAVKQPGSKIVVFSVSGTIYLTSALDMDCGDLTILGQTAPGDGICLADFPVTISGSNIIVRFMRFRLGNRQVARHEGDGLGIERGNNIILDHCSISWSIDECLSITEGSNITVQWCIIAQSLNNAGHQKGPHGYGGNWGGRNVSYLHNLIAQCTSRVPRLGGDGYMETPDFVDIRNNVFYNWGGQGCYGAEATDANFVNNYYKPGPATGQRGTNYRKRICSIGIRTTKYCNREVAADGTVTGNSWLGAWHCWGHFYVDGNVNPDYADVTADNWTHGIYNQISSANNDNTFTAVTRDTMRLREPREYMLATTWTAEEAYRRVLKFAGCFSCAHDPVDGQPAYRRDCLDSLIIAQVINRLGEKNSGTDGATYGHIDLQTDNVTSGQLSASQVENGAWPILVQTDEQTGPYSEYAATYLNQAVRALADSCQQPELQSGVTRETATYTTDILPAHTYEVSTRTFKGYISTARQQLYADGFVIQNAGGGLTGGKGYENCLKLRPQQYRILIPADFSIDHLRIYGYSNYKGTDINITELCGEAIPAGTYVIDATPGARTSIEIPLARPISGDELTITFQGNTPVVKFFFTDSRQSTGIEQVRPTQPAPTASRYFDLLGREAAAHAKGFMIRDGKKIAVR